MYDKGTCYPTFAHPTESLNDHSSWAILNVLGNVVLDRGGVRQIQVLPSEVKEVPKVSYTRVNVDLLFLGA